MSAEQVQLRYLKGVISEMTPDQQAKVAEIAAQLRVMLTGHACGEAHIAIAMVSLECLLHAEVSRQVLTEADALADLNGTPRPDSPAVAS